MIEIINQETNELLVEILSLNFVPQKGEKLRYEGRIFLVEERIVYITKEKVFRFKLKVVEL